MSLLLASVLSACGGSRDNDETPPNPPPSGATVTISGKITFERVPFKPTLGTGLNFSATVDQPARGVVVEALSGTTQTVLASTTTNASGDYAVQVPAGQSVRMRAKAQMLSTASPTMNFRVLDNTSSNALYTLEGSASSSGTADSTRDLRAASGWGGASYIVTRAAAPFAILDTVYKAKDQIVNVAAGTNFPALDLYWSEDNKEIGDEDPFCTDNGDLITTFYNGDDPQAGNCVTLADPGGFLAGGIYILGFIGGGSGDTDEFDEHVIAHEFGHYVEDRFGRSDSLGGEHGPGQRLDLRVAFSEGWGNAYSGMVLDNPVYRDSSGTSADGGMNMETGTTVAQGWFSEASVHEILWDAYDTPADAGDTVALGFGPLFNVFVGAQKTTDAFTSIYSFAAALKSANGSQTSGITALLTRENISGSGAFGDGETNPDPAISSVALPVYETVMLNDGQHTLCTTKTFGNYNKLDNRRFLTLTLATGGTVSISAAGVAGPLGAPATDPDMIVWRRGVDMNLGGKDDKQTEPVEMINQAALSAGTYVIEVYDYDLLAGSNTAACMAVSVIGS